MGSEIAETESTALGPTPSLGADIRALRRSRGLTLAALSGEVGRSVGWLSEVERGICQPTISDLRRIAAALGQPVSLFFGPAPGPDRERGRIVRAGARRMLGTAAGGLVEELLSPDLSGSFEILRSVFDPGAELAEPARRATEEAGYLVSGRLDLWIGGELYRLDPGDSFRVVDAPVRWRNPGPEPAVAIWVIAPPVY